MQLVMAIFFFVLVFYLFLQFTRQEDVQEEYEEAILDIEGRLEWAQTRRSHPFGMQAQLQVSRELLHRAKGLWAENRWQQAYRVALKSQEAMNRAQRLYISSLQTDHR